MPKHFIKKIEDFTCTECGAFVHGTGYTNHCPKCLWSKHVDVNPGDRLSPCGGRMKPMAVRVTRDGYDVLQRCLVCGHERWNGTAPVDDMAVIIKLSTHASN